MANTDIRCHGACVYSGCSVICNNTREKKLWHCRPPLMCSWDGVTAWEWGERQSDSQWRQGGWFESLPGSLLVATRSAVRTSVMGKS